IFSSRRRHTRSKRDWSSDVCSSDLVQASAGFIYGLAELYAAEITFSNVDISMAENAKPGRPAMMANIENMTNRGFYVGFAKDLQIGRASCRERRKTSGGS